MTRISDDIRKWCNLCGGIIDSGDKAELRDLTDRILKLAEKENQR